MSNSTYNVAIIGCGSMGVENLFERGIPFIYSFAGAVFNNSRLRLVALIDTDQKKLEQIQARLAEGGYPSDFGLYSSLEEAWRACDMAGQRIDIVCCAAGPQMNGFVIRQADNLSLKGVFCEKPLSLSLAEADELEQVERKTGLPVQVNYLRNFERHHRAVLDYIRKGGIGDLLTVRVNYKGGVLAVAPHALAFLGLLFDRPLSVTGSYSPLLNGRCLEDPNVDGIICYSFGDRKVNVMLTATGRGDPLTNNTYIFEIEFTGVKARITILENGWRVRYERMEASRVFGDLGEMMPYETAAIPLELKADAPREFMVDGLAELVRAIDQKERTSASVATTRVAEEVAHALAVSAKEKRTIDLPLSDRSHAFTNARAGVKFLRQEQVK